MTADRLDRAYHLSRNTSNRDRWTAEEWLVLASVFEACDWDMKPDEWSPAQVALALALGVPPRFDDYEKPIDGTHKGGKRLSCPQRDVVADELLRVLIVGYAVETYHEQLWQHFRAWARLLDETGKEALVRELYVP